MRSLACFTCAFVAVTLSTSSAWADRVLVLPFSAAPGATVTKPELAQARVWTEIAVRSRGDTLPSTEQAAAAQAVVQDGTADTSDEYRAAGSASGSSWTVTGRVEPRQVPPLVMPDGSQREGYTLYRVELEVARVETGRVESLAREVDPEQAVPEIQQMLALLLRPEGIANATIPWDSEHPRRPPKPKPKPAPKPAPPKLVPAPPKPPPPKPAVRHPYGEDHPFALGLSAGVSNALGRPSQARGPSWAMPLGLAGEYAFAAAPGLAARAVFTSQVIGPKALEMTAGARYAIGVLPQYRIYIGPELLIGAHAAIGADKTVRFLTHGSAFAAIGIGPRVQVEIAGDLSAALGGTGTLLLGGGTARVLARF